MKDFKTFQWIIISLAELGFISLLGCQPTDQKSLPANYTNSVSSRPKKTALTYENYLEHYPQNAPIEDVMEYVLQYGSPHFGNLRGSVLKEKSKFRQMASACLTIPKRENGKLIVLNYPVSEDGKENILTPEFPPPIQLEVGVYLVRLLCVRGILMNTYSFFIYTDQEGINPDALKLSVGSVSKSRVFDTYKTTEILALESGFVYDSSKQELQVTLHCRAATGSMNSQTVYKYKNKNLSLLEYWQDDPQNDKCLQKTNLRQFYP